MIIKYKNTHSGNVSETQQRFHHSLRLVSAMKSKVADLTWFCSLQFQTPFRCCCCCLLQTTLSCQVTNTSIDFRNKYINSVVSLVASGAQILSNNCKHLYDCILKHSEYHHSETTPVYLTVVRVRRMVLRLYNLQS